MVKRIHVVAAVIRGHNHKILIAKRPDHLHMGGLWEFPGGKVEQRESPLDALKRELKEEVGLTVVSAIPLIQIKHDYPDKHVYLDVWEVNEFVGVASGVEGQDVKWVSLTELNGYEFPAANQAIVTSAVLPSTCLITGDADSASEYLAPIESALSQGFRLFILRPALTGRLDLGSLCSALTGLTFFADAQWQWHSDWLDIAGPGFLKTVNSVDNFGVHFSSRNTVEDFALYSGCLRSASCHSEIELDKVQKSGMDFVLLSPVLPTKDYRPDELLGWNNFSALVTKALIPVFALGGLTQEDVKTARLAGAQGVACVRAWWS